MDVVELRQRPPGAGSYSWSLVLPRRGGGRLEVAAMNASELMFFYGAPFAHIVAYEAHLKEARHEKAAREMLRSRRVPHLMSHLAGASLPELAEAESSHGA